MLHLTKSLKAGSPVTWMSRGAFLALLKGALIGLGVAGLVLLCPWKPARVLILCLIMALAVARMLWLSWQLRRSKAAIEDRLRVLEAVGQLDADEWAKRFEE